MPDYDLEPHQRILNQHTEFDRRGGWTRISINLMFAAFVLLAIFTVLLTLDMRQSANEVGAQLVPVVRGLVLLACAVAVVAFAVTCRKWKQLRGFQKTLGLTPFFMWLGMLVWSHLIRLW